MKIWLDLANSPQVLFFRPILNELKTRGHTVIATTRDYAQTVQLAEKFGLQNVQIGRHGGRGLYGLISQNILRVLDLMRWARGQGFDLALSHNSYSQVVAAALLRLPSVTLMDYEHQPLNHICFRLSRRVIVPEPFPTEYLRKYGAGRKAVHYHGIKEQMYLADFQPMPTFLQQEGLPADKPLVVIRPPAPWTAYHRFENELFDRLLAFLNTKVDHYCLFLPRLSAQADSVRALDNIHVATKVYDGPNLLYYADVVISGGGTMNREAAVLGTPTYTIFKGVSGAVDRYLIRLGRMVQIESEADFPRIRLGEKVKLPDMTDRELVTEISDYILDA